MTAPPNDPPTGLRVTTRRLLLAAIALWWALASVLLFAAGAFYGRANRYDDCAVAFVGPTLVRACPIGTFRERPPVPPTGVNA